MVYPKHLIFFSDQHPGFTRHKWGRGFRYLDSALKPLKKAEQITRIKDLVIPPAWKKVWISPLSNGHLQSTGVDERKRKQYLYHPDWVAYRQGLKFDKLILFGASLPEIRSSYFALLRTRKWTKQKVVAMVIYLLDKHYFRIGNKYYTSHNETYGLTTLRRKHVVDSKDDLQLKYKAKSGKDRKVKIDNARIKKLIRELSELPGYEIFRYQTEAGNYTNLDSSDVNEYLKDISGQNFTAKDFRTWGATKLAFEGYEPTIQKLEENEKLKFKPTLVKWVAKQMGNTVSVCRKYYIHPDILEYLSSHYPEPLSLDDGNPENELSPAEHLILKILKS